MENSFGKPLTLEESNKFYLTSLEEKIVNLGTLYFCFGAPMKIHPFPNHQMCIYINFSICDRRFYYLYAVF